MAIGAALRLVKPALKPVLLRTGLAATAAAAPFLPSAAGRGIIFTLHHVRTRGAHESGPNAHLSVTPEGLDAAITLARGMGFAPAALDDLPRRLAEEPERRFVVFTLDDGYRDNAEWAAPVFRRHGVPYTIFLTEGFFARTHTLWWETAERLVGLPHPLRLDLGRRALTLPLATPADRHRAFAEIAALVLKGDEDAAVAALDRAAVDHGIDPHALTAELTLDAAGLAALAADPLARFGAHTVSHVALPRVPPARLAAELARSADAIAGVTGHRPASFAYPYGFAGAREFQAAAEAGFSLAVTTRPGVLTARRMRQPTALPRVSLNGLYQRPHQLRALLSGLPFRFM
ncbi:polysaccharide deacetylase family protein [Prosthecomicrobium pneumaticum]|uniref:Chitooligosaccharide deacetylase n=1 Tax=Prosthecomicrobium pneumaticum TaxID=81895 RepID=A0A7W9CVG7_9HYPH|nr:polysaccharide deacetylase family protein [Prosthecomicrobium pneumaticum]MBB5752409.1 peptidoglycan/xylan/chitin deacetylase (PgdA/CDA1 family) [Prosthecomicrobium pneumaticum]